MIPTASETDPVDVKRHQQTFTRRFGVKNVTVLHTRDRAEADKEEFVAPLKTARGVWFSGGRQWRLVDAYMGTRTQREIEVGAFARRRDRRLVGRRDDPGLVSRSRRARG